MKPLSVVGRSAALTMGAALALSGCYNAAPEYRRLVESNVSIAGTIAAVDCGNHGLVIYSFVAPDGEHRARAPRDMFDCRTTRPGDAVTVYYDPARPRVNTLLSPEVAYAQARGWYVPEPVFIVGMPVLCIVISIVILSRRRRVPPAPQGSVK